MVGIGRVNLTPDPPIDGESSLDVDYMVGLTKVLCLLPISNYAMSNFVGTPKNEHTAISS